MTRPYTPPFTITAAIVSLIAEISQGIGRLSVLAEAAKSLRLRRISRIRTIQGSLAIEGNTLTIEQITAILEGKRVIAPPREIVEVRNAIKAYNLFEAWTPFSKADLLAAHNTLMTGLLDVPGKFRDGGVGVMAGERVIHLAPPAERVPALMSDLLHWLQNTDQHPLLASSVFHYEFEFIHPFEDGNGRIGRLWQTLTLSKWNPLFANIPVESLVHEHQQEYYDSINKSTENAESSIFIEFMLRMILEAVTSIVTPEVAPEVTPEVRKMLSVLSGEMTRRNLQQKLGLLDEKHFRESYLQPAIAAGLMEMTIPDKPNSRLQKYRLTSKGAAFIGTGQ
ncbi:MAG: cell filamentation protein Fic [Geobacteraceae bacterium GWB2_52_12]|nr:MAG: cell filamentation protein Fic [Geobacteraceae bacterium GWB2_52_12]